jgi:hypothetical protein
MKRPALVAGIGLLAMAVTAPIAVFALLPNQRFGPATAVFLSVAALDVVVALALHAYVGPAAPRLSASAAALRIVYALLLVVATRHLIAGRADDFRHEWDLGLVVFGLHLVLVGAVVFALRGALRLLGFAVVVAGLGYVADGVGVALRGHAPGFASVAFVGEVALMIWLLWKGARARPPTNG